MGLTRGPNAEITGTAMLDGTEPASAPPEDELRTDPRREASR